MKRLTIVLLVLCLIVPALAAPEWQIETVDEPGFVNSFSSLALDSSGNPHISYYDGGNSELKYARWDGSTWQIETVDEPGRVGLFTSLALDSSDNPHISYWDDANSNLKYACWDGSAWQIETVDSDGNVGRFTSLALDSSDNPHISYRDSSNTNLKYARWDGTSWHLETVDPAEIEVTCTSLALDSSDNPHISYYDDDNNDLRYAHWDGSAWQLETVDPGNAGKYPSLALDSSGRPHISYFDALNGCLKYAHWNDSTWLIEIVDQAETGVTCTSLVLDSSGRPHISYWDDADDDLEYARWDGTSWQLETVDSSSTSSLHTFIALALDSYDNPHISYLDDNNYDLKYAWYGDPAGVESVDLYANAKDEGVLLSWSIVGDEPASVRVLRGLTQNDTLTQNGSVDLSGELSGSATSWLDVSAEAGVEYAYYLEVTELDGTVSRFGPSEVIVPGMASELALSDPYPNPADDSLTIHYELTQNATVKLYIYDVAGRLVETLVSGEQTAGRHSVSWDSSTAATGVYLLRLEANGEAVTKRAVISR